MLLWCCLVHVIALLLHVTCFGPAFAFLSQHLMTLPEEWHERLGEQGPLALVMAPTRELSQQIEVRTATISTKTTTLLCAYINVSYPPSTASHQPSATPSFIHNTISRVRLRSLCDTLITAPCASWVASRLRTRGSCCEEASKYAWALQVCCAMACDVQYGMHS